MTRSLAPLLCLLVCEWAVFGCAYEVKQDDGPSARVDPSAAPVSSSTSAPATAAQTRELDGLALRELLAEPTESVERRAVELPEANHWVRVKILGLNDFHGALSGGSQIEGRRLGGAAVLASYLRAHSRGFEGRVMIVHAGDFVGASPAVSALFHDQPSIEFFNQLSNGNCVKGQDNPDCNLLGALGNHEFDRGTTELLRLMRGGDRAWTADGKRFAGQLYATICANLLDARTGRPLVSPFVVRSLGAIQVGFVGAVLAGASWFLKKSGIGGLTFADEAESINRAVSELRKRGVRTIVLVIHQGGRQRFSRLLPRDASSVQGEVKDIISRLDGEIDVVISGHSHSALSALVPNRDNRPTLLTQAFHSGTAFSEIELDIDTDTGELVRKRAVIVSTFSDVGPGLTPDPQVERLVRRAELLAERTTSVRLSRAASEISSDVDAHGESPMGDLIADAQRAALRTDMAFTTPSWVRADLNAGEVTWGDLFTVQPFGNRLMRVEMLGREVIDLLNQQWYVETYPRMLQVSGLTFSWDARQPRGARIVDVLVNGRPIEPLRRYAAAVNEFLAEGGEGYSVLAKLRRRATAITDIQALTAYVKARPSLEPPAGNRIKRLDLEPRTATGTQDGLRH